MCTEQLVASTVPWLFKAGAAPFVAAQVQHETCKPKLFKNMFDCLLRFIVCFYFVSLPANNQNIIAGHELERLAVKSSVSSRRARPHVKDDIDEGPCEYFGRNDIEVHKTRDALKYI